jgi:8-oxo-dGTP pyrophosphatase MutT (NUDIX family)
MGRTEYWNDPAAPKPNSLVPAAGVLAVDHQGRLLLQRRRDTGQWAIPMGKQEFGETPVQCAIRETQEETGVVTEITGLLGIYSDPDLPVLDIHPTQRRQLRDWLDGTAPHFD